MQPLSEYEKSATQGVCILTAVVIACLTLHAQPAWLRKLETLAIYLIGS